MTEIQFSTFYLDDALFGIDILLVKEINRHLELTPVAGAPEFIRGLLNLRGQIVTVVDLGIKLGFGPRPIGSSSRCIVLKASADLARLKKRVTVNDDTYPDVVGLLVDRIGDMVTVAAAKVEPPPANIAGLSTKFLLGVVQMEGELLLGLRVGEVLRYAEKKTADSPKL